MSYDLYAYAPEHAEISTQLLHYNLEVFGWHGRLLNDDNIIVTDLAQATAVMAWDYSYMPAPKFTKRFVPGKMVDFDRIAKKDVIFLAVSGIDASIIPRDELSEEFSEYQLGEEEYRQCMERFGTESVHSYNFGSSPVGSDYGLILQNDLARIYTYVTDGVFCDPQEGAAYVIDDLPAPELTPLKRFEQSINAFEEIINDQQKRDALIQSWLK